MYKTNWSIRRIFSGGHNLGRPKVLSLYAAWNNNNNKKKLINNYKIKHNNWFFINQIVAYITIEYYYNIIPEVREFLVIHDSHFK